MNNVVKIMCLVVLALAFAAGVEAKTLKFATLAPAGTTWMKEMKTGAERVKQRTGGRVKMKFYPGGVMGNDRSVHRKIRIGQLHGGAFGQAGLSQVNPGIQVLGLPMLFRSQDEVAYVRQHMDAVMKQDTEKGGFVLLGISEGGFARILSKHPMQDLESLRSSKVWVPEGDEVGLTVFRGLGITPISPRARHYTDIPAPCRCFHRLANRIDRNGSGQSGFGYRLSMAFQRVLYDRCSDNLPGRPFGDREIRVRQALYRRPGGLA